MERRIVLCFVFAFVLREINGNNNASEREKYKVAIIGAGISGLGAATHLLKNNFTDILILEASNRIGGRVYTAPFGDYLIEYGAQWVHGQGGNAVYQIVKPYDLLVEEDYEERLPNFAIHSQSKINLSLAVDSYAQADAYFNDSEALKACNCSLEKYFSLRLNNLTHEKNLNEHTVQAVKDIMQKFQGAREGTDNISIIGSWGFVEYGETNGSFNNAWKSGYHSFIDIITGKYDGNELPVLNKTKFNKVVQNINWSGGEVDVLCEDGTHYFADHVITTVSLGVLKHSAKTLFTPSLPERKLSAIKSLGFDLVNKILIHFHTRWWPLVYHFDLNFLWSDEDKEKFRNVSKHGEWSTELTGFHFVINQPRILEGWIMGEAARKLEQQSDKDVTEGVMELLNWFVGDKYSISQPINVTRSGWASNRFVRGSYSFRTVDSDYNGYFAADLSEPLPQNHATPSLLFAGEATHDSFRATVHGAFESGLREANRILNFKK